MYRNASLASIEWNPKSFTTKTTTSPRPEHSLLGSISMYLSNQEWRFSLPSLPMLNSWSILPQKWECRTNWKGQLKQLLSQTLPNKWIRRRCTWCAQGVGFGFNSYFNSPVHWHFQQWVRWCLRKDLGVLELFYNVDCMDCSLIHCKSKSKVGMRLYCVILPLSFGGFRSTL